MRAILFLILACMITLTVHATDKEYVSKELLKSQIGEIIARSLNKDKEAIIVRYIRNMPEAAAIRLLPNTLIKQDAMGRFKIKADIASKKEKKTFFIQGQYEEFVKVPVIKQQLQPGHIIRKKDLIWKHLSKQKLSKGTVFNHGQIIGKSLRRTLVANQPIRANDLKIPLLVKRRDMVTMLLQTSFMQLNTVGIALEAGSKGEVIRIKNAKSGRIVQAEIVTDKVVRVNISPRNKMFNLAVNGVDQ